MRPTNLATVGLIGLMGCVESTQVDSAPKTLVLEPANVSVTVVDGQAIAQPYRATLVDSDGVTNDVTAETTFVLANESAGAWAGSLLTINGEAVGPTHIVAAHGGLQAKADLTVYSRSNRLLDAPANAAAMFERAVSDTGCVPEISYPADHVVMPPNLGELDVQWIDTRNDLFEVSVATSYVETRIYTRAPAWTKLAAADWTRLAAQHEPLALRVSGVVEAVPQVRCNTVTQHISLTDQPISGDVYLANALGVQRVDAAQPMIAAESIFSAAMWDAMFAPLTGSEATGCLGCAISRDGRRLAIASPTTGALYDFATHTLTAPGAQSWSEASFTANGEKLITANGGDLHVITRNGQPLTSIVHKNGYQGFDPQVSPDGRWLANVEAIDPNAPTMQPGSGGAPSTTTIEQPTSLPAFGSTIVVRQFFDGSNEMGGSTELMPLVAGIAAYYPAWSPDGRYIVFTRATDYSGTNDVTAALYIMRADGTQPPIQLTSPSHNLVIRARFIPNELTVDGERVLMIAFESRQAFGEQLPAGRLQLWAMPFYPDRTIESSCIGTAQTVCAPKAMAPAMRMPTQSLAVDNRMLSWVD